MDVIMTSFGVSHLQRARINTDIFFRMPPATLTSAGQQFMPDYAALLLTDRIVIDQKTYELLTSGRHESFGHVALMAEVLHDEEFVRLEDFDTIISRNRKLLDKMLTRDMRELESWVEPLRESAEEWRRFVAGFRGSLREDFLEGRLAEQGIDDNGFHEDVYMEHIPGGPTRLAREALYSSRRRRESAYRDEMREVLSEYLSYVNINLLLANELGGGIYDWSDFQPFYRDKFLRVARSAIPTEKECDSIRKLFEVSFPAFTFWTPTSIIRALNDKRILELRNLVESSIRGDVTFDKEFATRVLWVLKVERSIGKLRNLVSYLTLPLGLIPWAGDVIQKGVEEAIVQPIGHLRLEKGCAQQYSCTEDKA